MHAQTRFQQSSSSQAHCTDSFFKLVKSDGIAAFSLSEYLVWVGATHPGATENATVLGLWIDKFVRYDLIS